MKIKFLLTAVLAMVCSLQSHAADSLKITLNRQNFVSGDTLYWNCELQGYDDSYKLATLQVFIEDVKGSRSWQYRFPVVGKKSSGSMHINASIPDGKYAVNFMLQKDFFSIRGRASYYPLKDTAVDYIMVLRNKQTVIRNAPLQPGGRFIINRLIFEDTAFFAFSAVNEYENFRVRLVTPLDSAFEPEVTVTKIIRISQMVIADPRLAIPTASNYNFDYKTKGNSHLLDNVTIVAKKKKAAEEYADKYVSTTFRSINDMTFDGIEDEEIGRSVDIFNFLQGHVAGLTFTTDNTTGAKTPSWRGSTSDIYLDEVKIDPDQVSTINTEDIAMVKVFRPGSGPLTGGGNGTGGAIAIYTKRGNYAKQSEKAVETRYKIFGYNSLDMEWQ